MKYNYICVLTMALMFTLNNNSILKGQEDYKFEFVATKWINYAEGAFGGSWSTKDSLVMKGLVIKLKLSANPEMQPFNTAYLFFEGYENGVKFSAQCQGISAITDEKSYGMWIFNENNKFFEKSPPKEAKTEYVNFLFAVSPKVKTGNLKYKDKVILEKIMIKTK